MVRRGIDTKGNISQAGETELPSTSTSPSSFNVHTSTIFDPKLKDFRHNVSLTVDSKTGLITKVYTRSSSSLPLPTSSHDIDLRGLLALPGFVDAHTHILLHPYAEAHAINQERDESLVERVIRATNHCRTALLAGYTTYRDLGTEGIRNADTDIRNAVNRGLIPGPRMFVATECIASSGGYEIRYESGLNGTSVPRISDPADGPYACRAAVRRRLAAGADIVKIYADYGKRQLRWPGPTHPGGPEIQFPPTDVVGMRNPNVLLWTQEEMNAMVDEAKRANAPVAVHACSPAAVIMAAKAGPTTVEHGWEEDDGSSLQVIKDNNCIFVPTLAIHEVEGLAIAPVLARTKRAFDMGIKLACGGDIGPVPHGENARELELMVDAGVPVREVLTAATLHGWEACGGERCGRRFGWWEEGCAADVIALGADPSKDKEAFRKVDFVMKDGRVWKKGGEAEGMI